MSRTTFTTLLKRASETTLVRIFTTIYNSKPPSSSQCFANHFTIYNLNHSLELENYILKQLSLFMRESFKNTSVPNPSIGITLNDPPKNFAYARDDGNPKP